jgi:hypothetical protein
MVSHAQQRQWLDAVEEALSERGGAERYRLRQREMRSGGRAADDRAAPLEFDERGFPIPQPVTGFVRRLGRLLWDG